MQSEVPVQVAVRVRPLLGSEVNKDPCLYCIPDEPQLVLGKSKHFIFDHVFPEVTSQKTVYTHSVAPLVPVFFEGYNTTVFAYGQTGSGKTYTMATGNRIYLDEEECGIIPRAITDIFNTIENISDKCVCKLRISFIEVYKEELKDLLESSSGNVQVMDDENGNTVVMGVQEEEANNVHEVLNLLDAGTAMRHVGSTNMNEESSRSHCIFTMILDQYPIVETTDTKGKQSVLSSRFHFVDLAGSERAQRTGNQGERFKESISINTGLLALGNVISALAEKRRDKHVPYRESKLTRILKDSLGGNSRTVMITCLSPALADLDENINSLKYAERARKIRNTPIVNFDMEASKITRMETEIEALKGQLQKRASNILEFAPVDIQKISDLEIENEKHEVEQNYYLQQLHEINIMLQAIELSVQLSPALKKNIEMWRKNWQKYHFDRPLTAPTQSRGSAVKRPQNNILENLRNELSKCKERLLLDKDLLGQKTCEVKKIEEEMELTQHLNKQLQQQLNAANKAMTEVEERLVQQQLLIEGFKNNNAGAHGKFMQERTNSLHKSASMPDCVMQSFRAKSELLISRINDLDNVEYDENISSDDEDGEIVSHWNRSDESTQPALPQSKTFVSQIPRPSIAGKNTPKQSRHINNRLSACSANDAMNQLESERICARDGARTAEMNVREVSNRMKELEQNIVYKESLIQNLQKSEKEARATSSTFRMKLNKIEKDYEKSRRDLEELQEKMNNMKDLDKKGKLEVECKKKVKDLQKKYEDLKQKETVSNRISSYQENNEKRVKDLEAWIARMKNQHIELDRKLKDETEKKSKHEQELRKYELRIKELELKTDQQQKLLKRKNEEVVAAQRKLRTNDTSKTSDAFEQKKQWIDAEIEKIMQRQQDMEQLENKLRERDESLRKKEALINEKEELEVKRTRSSQNLSRSLLHLSTQVESVDEKIQQLSIMPNKNKFSKDIQQLQRVKQDLTSQRVLLEQSEETGGLDVNESRHLIELGEAIEAIDEAIQFKNTIIEETKSTIEEIDENSELCSPDHIELLLSQMGELTSKEYRNLLGKQFYKVIQLRKMTGVADDARCHFELKISDQERKVYDLQRMLQVSETRHEKMLLEQNNKYEKDIQFLMEQLRVMEADGFKENVPLEKKVNQLEKELYYYKAKSRKYKDHHNSTSNDEPNTPVERTNTKESVERKASCESNQGGRSLREGERKGSTDSNHNTRGGNDVEEFRLPNISSHHALVKKDNLEKKVLEHHHNAEDARRLQEIFDGKPPSSPSANRSASKRNGKKKMTEDLYQGSINADSMESPGKNPWIH